MARVRILFCHKPLSVSHEEDNHTGYLPIRIKFATDSMMNGNKCVANHQPSAMRTRVSVPEDHGSLPAKCSERSPRLYVHRTEYAFLNEREVGFE